MPIDASALPANLRKDYRSDTAFIRVDGIKYYRYSMLVDGVNYVYYNRNKVTAGEVPDFSNGWHYEDLTPWPHPYMPGMYDSEGVAHFPKAESGDAELITGFVQEGATIELTAVSTAADSALDPISVTVQLRQLRVGVHMFEHRPCSSNNA